MASTEAWPGWARLGASLLVLAVAVAVPAPAPGAGDQRSVFIVELTGPPLAVPGEDPAGRRARLDATEAEVRRRAGAGAAPVIYRYRTAFNGFAARLTVSEAAGLEADPGVLSVTPDRLRTVDAAPADTGPAGTEGPAAVDGAGFLGLRDGLWARVGGPDHAGEGVVVGFLDTGVHPEHPSFADPGLVPPPGWAGTCQEGEAFPASLCTGKLVGARFFADGFGKGRVAEADFLSARDSAGHGSHVAASAVGNGVVPDVDGGDLGLGVTSGVAPRAQLAAYKVCWTGREDLASPVGSGCADSDSLAAVDTAVADGVDVLNLSLSTESTAYGPLDSALLNAVAAGVFVSTSAGNRGPEPGTVGAPGDAPWVTSVAATSLPRVFVATATVRNPDQEPLSVTGASITGTLVGASLVDGAVVPAAGVTTAQAALCLAGSLDPAAVAGKAVFCRRGDNARVEKSAAVADAGGVGMILSNATDDEDTSLDHHSVPTVHLTRADGAAVAQRLGYGSTHVSITAARPAPALADQVGEFSSRGPQGTVPDIPKPDLAAPGVTVLSAIAPPGSQRPDLRSEERDVHGRRSPGRSRRPAHPDPFRLVAVGPEVGAHDHGHRRGHRRRGLGGGTVRHRLGAHRPQPGGGPRPRVGGDAGRLCPLPRGDQARGGDRRLAAHRPVRPQPARRVLRPSDRGGGDPAHLHERGRGGRQLAGDRPGRAGRGGHGRAAGAHPGPGPDR